MPSYYPVFLNISGKDCLVIGGGKIAERKILSLLKAEAKITVISETLTKKLKNEFEKGNIRFIQKSFDIEDIKTAFLVIAATSDNETNKLIALNSPFLVNVVDNPTLSNFIVPSVVSKKPLTIAISTEGSSPSFASVIKKDIESLYGKDIGSYLKFLKEFRKKVLKEINNENLRRQILTFIASKSMVETLKKEGLNKTKKLVISYYNSKKSETLEYNKK